MKHTFVSLLHGIEISENLGSGEKINDRLKITNDHKKISSLFNEEHKQIIGDMETTSLLSGAPVVFAEASLTQEMTQQEFLLSCIYEVQLFLMTTWVIQDNSINCEISFLFSGSGKLSHASSNFVAHLYSTATGTKSITKLSREKLREMRLLHHETILTPEHPYKMPPSQLTSSHPRISRAILMINAARGTPDIAIKIAHYCTAFETLFSTSQSELAHQLSERIACYLHKGGGERLSAYKKLKLAYSLRSKVVHGATLNAEKLDNAFAAAKYCDEAARQIFFKLLTNASERELFELKTDAFDDSMLRMIFGFNSDAENSQPS